MFHQIKENIDDGDDGSNKQPLFIHFDRQFFFRWMQSVRLPISYCRIEMQHEKLEWNRFWRREKQNEMSDNISAVIQTHELILICLSVSVCGCVRVFASVSSSVTYCRSPIIYASIYQETTAALIFKHIILCLTIFDVFENRRTFVSAVASSWWSQTCETFIVHTKMHRIASFHLRLLINVVLSMNTDDYDFAVECCRDVCLPATRIFAFSMLIFFCFASSSKCLRFSSSIHAPSKSNPKMNCIQAERCRETLKKTTRRWNRCFDKAQTSSMWTTLEWHTSHECVLCAKRTTVWAQVKQQNNNLLVVWMQWHIAAALFLFLLFAFVFGWRRDVAHRTWHWIKYK